jgi:hypothetical protein
MKVLVMTLIRSKQPYVVHGQPVPLDVASSFVGARKFGSIQTYSWLMDAWRPHTCEVHGCLQNRVRLRVLWSRIAQRATVVCHARRALLARFPPELAEHVLAFVSRR